MQVSKHQNLAELAYLFTRLGFTAFGGPASHIAMMRDEVVAKRNWLSDEEFLNLVGMANLIPGPNSTELAIHIGYRRAGNLGLIVAGLCFILPAMSIVLILAWAYKSYGVLPEVKGLLAGMSPVVVAIVLKALFDLGKSTLKSPTSILIALAAAAIGYLGLIGELWIVFVPGLVLGLVTLFKHSEPTATRRLLSISAGIGVLVVATAGIASLVITKGPVTLSGILIYFLKVGSVLYGSGYVLLSYLNADLVVRLGWLTRHQLLDAVSVGQFTPGPVFTTATFIGYLLGGVPGAILATIGIFLPSFFLVKVSAQWLEKLKDSATTQSFLSGVNASSLGLMVAVLITLGQSALTNPWTICLAITSIVILLTTKVNSVWLLFVGAAIGMLATSM